MPLHEGIIQIFSPSDDQQQTWDWGCWRQSPVGRWTGGPTPWPALTTDIIDIPVSISIQTQVALALARSPHLGPGTGTLKQDHTKVGQDNGARPQ